jgi:hypothetical protein
MSEINTGGPAFPSIRDIRHRPDFDSEEGMTLRDYFAAQAMQAFVSAWVSTNTGPDNDLKVAEYAYAMADAMLEAREKQT